LAATAALGLGGCASLGYYWQSASGHLQMMNAARPVSEWLVDPQADERLKRQLQTAQRLRAFASRALHLPDSPSYTHYADLRREAVLWNVMAAPPLSLTLQTWCFPVAGCVGYRGYYDEAQAQAEAASLRAQGLDVAVYPVPAYSTLGWLNWAGGDPLLNTFIHYPEGELARLIFHELAHQVVYVKDDTAFNESFATAVERLGVRLWLASDASDAARQMYEQVRQRREQLHALTRATRARLAAAYAPGATTSGETQTLLARKQAILQDFRDRYAHLRAAWAGDPARWRATDRWVQQANNAAFGAEAAYDQWVPAFEALFEREGRDWPRFYDAVRKLSQMPRDRRDALLKELSRA
jgi:predicted aminopeptidase